MKADTTRNEFAQTFLELADQFPLNQISISMIIGKCGKNRNTFYYHFQDKTSLIIWIFRKDLAEQLLTADESVELVYEAEDGPLSAFPYYAREVTGIRAVNTSFFLKSLITVLEGRREFYAQVFCGFSRSDMMRYLFDLMRGAMQTDLDIIASGRYLPQNDRILILDYHVSGLLGFIEHVLSNSSINLNMFITARFLNLICDSMSYEIENKRF